MATASIKPGTFAAVKAQTDNTANIRKRLELIPLLAPMTAAVPDTLFGTDGTITIPDGYFPVGAIDPKGIEISGKIDKDTIESFGYGTPTRTDFMGVAKTIKLTAQERYKAQLESVFAMQDLTGIAPDASGQLIWDEVAVPIASEYRLMLIARDINKGTGSDILDARVFTRVSLSDVPGESLTEKGAADVDLQFDVLEDSTLGTPCRHILGGKGLAELMPVLGWASTK